MWYFLISSIVFVIISIHPVKNQDSSNNNKRNLTDEMWTVKLGEQYGEKSVFTQGASIT